MARSRIAVLRAGFLACAFGMGTVACVPAPVPDNADGAGNVTAPSDNDTSPDYVLCNSAGCGDANVVVDKGK